MNEQDKKISKIYTETVENVHASEDLKDKVINMKKSRVKTGKVIKIVCGFAAAVVVLAVGAMAVSASRAEFDTVILDGTETKAKYVDFGTGTRMWECIADDTSYCIFISGDYDTENNKLYLVDKGDYFLASTESDPTLNLYTDIDSSKFAEFAEAGGEKYLYVTDDAGTNQILFSDDEKDGSADGLIRNDDGSVKEAYALLPNGAVVNTVKTQNINRMKVLGYDSDKFWNDLYSQLDSYK